MSDDLRHDLRDLPPMLDVPTDFYERVITQARRRRRAVRAAATGFTAAVVAVVVAVAVSFSNVNSTARLVPITPPPSAVTPTTSPTVPPSVSTSTTPSPPATPSTPATVASVQPSSAPSAPVPTAVTPVDTSILAYGDCLTPTVEPSAIVTACADRGLVFQDLHWTSWTATSATAVGTEWYKTCVPYCAAGGSQTISNATVTLSDPVQDTNGRLIWSKIQFTPQLPGYATGPYHGGPYPLPVRPE